MTSNGVDDVFALAGKFLNGVVGNSCDVACYTSCFVEYAAVSAICSRTKTVTSLVLSLP